MSPFYTHCFLKKMTWEFSKYSRKWKYEDKNPYTQPRTSKGLSHTVDLGSVKLWEGLGIHHHTSRPVCCLQGPGSTCRQKTGSKEKRNWGRLAGKQAEREGGRLSLGTWDKPPCQSSCFCLMESRKKRLEAAHAVIFWTYFKWTNWRNSRKTKKLYKTTMD